MMKKRTKLIFICLFITQLLIPQIITESYFGAYEAYIQSLAIFISLFLIYITYNFYREDIEKFEKNKKEQDKKLESSKKKMIDAFKYIGKLNLRLPLLTSLPSDFFKYSKLSAKKRAQIFNELINVIVTSIIKTKWGMLRFVDTDNNNTLLEKLHTEKNYLLMKTTIANNKLSSSRIAKKEIDTIDDYHVMSSSDHNNPIQCFLIFPKKTKVKKDDLSLLQFFVDQAQLFYGYFYGNGNGNNNDKKTKKKRGNVKQKK